MRRSGVLKEILAAKTAEVEALGASRQELVTRMRDQSPPRAVLDQLARRDRVGVIAEVKRRSPSAGDISGGLDPVGLAARYAEGGALAISVLTDSQWFGGSMDDLAAVRDRVHLPVLRKDFVIDSLQVIQARAGGADLVLLIARVLEPSPLRDMRAMVDELGMTALVEAHDEWEVEAALEAGARLIGINNRDLAVFGTDLAVTERLADYVPGDVVLISESGITGVTDVKRVARAGADAVLVGEALVRSADPATLVREMASVERHRRNP